MKALLGGILRGLLTCALLLTVSLGLAGYAGLIEIPLLKLPDFRQASVETPGVYVVEPETDGDGETDPDGEALEETESGETDSGEIQAEDAEEPEAVTLLFAGDLYLTELLQSKYQKQGIQAAASEELLAALGEADIFMLNEEFPFGTTGEAAEDKQYTFRVDPGYVTVLQDLSVDIVTLANNHMLDFGRGPLTETLNVLDEKGIAHVGAGENLEEAKALKTFEAGSLTIGFLGASRVIPENSWTASAHNSGLFTTYDPTALIAQIQKAKESCDFVAVYVHWGVERSTQPEEYQRKMARQYIDAGADAVIGAHPHVLQGIEYYQGKPIFYSLGNFIFGNGTYQSVLAELTLENGETRVRLRPCMSEANRMRLLSGTETPAFYRELEGLSFGVSIGEDGTVKNVE